MKGLFITNNHCSKNIDMEKEFIKTKSSESDNSSNNEFDGNNNCFKNTLNDVYDHTSQLRKIAYREIFNYVVVENTRILENEVENWLTSKSLLFTRGFFYQIGLVTRI